MTLNINSITDAQTALGGYENWEFGGTATFDGLVEYLYRNSDDHEDKNTEFGNEQLDHIVDDYLYSQNEDPQSYRC